MASKTSKSGGVSSALMSFVMKPDVAAVLAAQTGTHLGATMSRFEELQQKLEVFLNAANGEHAKVVAGAHALDDAARKRQDSFAVAHDFETQLGAVQKELAEQMQLFFELAQLAGVPIRRPRAPKTVATGPFTLAAQELSGAVPSSTTVIVPETSAQKFARVRAELQAKMGASATETPVATAVVTSVKLFGADVALADLEAHVTKLLNEREAAIRTEAATAFADLKQKLDRANAQVTAKTAEVVALKAQNEAAVAELATIKTQLADSQAARLDLVNALNELVPLIDARRATDVQRIRKTYNLK